ncbi:hypothetical protein Scep_009314 [Stephania cephalantha]|uniref:Uncharacterized protein n=1 Tax=Stephania cephalantha TaxID=152367 RepID=A0AAP0JSX7_9MAGN
MIIRSCSWNRLNTSVIDLRETKTDLLAESLELMRPRNRGICSRLAVLEGASFLHLASFSGVDGKQGGRTKKKSNRSRWSRSREEDEQNRQGGG